MGPLLIVAAGPVFAVIFTAFIIKRIYAKSKPPEVTGASLHIDGNRYGGPLSLDKLRLGEARIVDLAAEKSLQPQWRTFGTGLPGYQSGWFKLKDGSKALLYLTGGARGLYIPTTSDYALLLGIENPEALLALLHERAAQLSAAARPLPR